MKAARDQASSIQSKDIVLRNISLAYRDAIAVEGLSGRFAQGSLTAIVGPNGAGKTTLLKSLLGLIKPVRGGIDCAWPPRAIAYLSQVNEIDRQFPITVSDFVAVGIWNRVGSLSAVGLPMKHCINDAIAAVGLQNFEHVWISDLSGGQFQRVRFARLLVQDAPVVLLDEPFAGVDAATVRDLLNLIHEWHIASKTIIAVLHDLDLVKQFFPNTLVLSGSRFFWDQTDKSLSALDLFNQKQTLAYPSQTRFSP